MIVTIGTGSNKREKNTDKPWHLESTLSLDTLKKILMEHDKPIPDFYIPQWGHEKSYKTEQAAKDALRDTKCNYGRVFRVVYSPIYVFKNEVTP